MVSGYATVLQVTWVDNSSNESGFRIERAGADGVFSQIGTVGANVASFDDANAASDSTYEYRVAAFNDAGQSAYSNVATISVPATSTVTNTPPTISAVAAQTIAEDTSTGALAVTIGDAETAADSLTLVGVSSDSALVPSGGIVLGGSGANRTVTVTPAANANGLATITLTVSDGSLVTSTNFDVTVTPVDDAPTISSLPDASMEENTAGVPIDFTIGDIDSPLDGLMLTGHSSNQTLVPDGNIVFGGSGANRMVTVTPAPNQTGPATIIVSVSDGTLSAATSFVLTVNAANTPPSISNIAAQTIAEDGSAGPIGFMVGDAESAAGTLTVTGSSSDPQLVPSGGIVLGGSGANRTVTVTPAANANGSATITVTVSDGALSAGTSFGLTVTPVNDAPTISPIAGQSITSGATSGTIDFSISDVETPADSLVVVAESSDVSLVPASGIVLGGSGGARTLTVTPAAGVTGTAILTVTVSDGKLSASTSFDVQVTAPVPTTLDFANSTSINIKRSGVADPYGSEIAVDGMVGAIERVQVSLYGFAHNATNEVNILLVSPDGQGVILMANVGSGRTRSADLTFADDAADSLPSSGGLSDGTYRPTNYATALKPFPAPAPAGPYGATLGGFTNASANGVWKLYVFDNADRDSGHISGGWSIEVTTSGAESAVSDPTAGGTTIGTHRLAVFSRMEDLVGSDVASLAFSVSGDLPGSLLVRALGPALTTLGVANPVAAPRLRVLDAMGNVVLDVGAWDGSQLLTDTFTRLGALPLESGSLDSAALVSLPTGDYSAQFTDDAGVGGALLAEIYDAGDFSEGRIATVGLQRHLDGAGSTLSGGFAVDGTTSERVLVVASGPALINTTDALADPVLRVYDQAGNLVAVNDNWEAPMTADAAGPTAISDALALVGMPPLASGSTDAAVIVTLPPGSYTFASQSVDGSPGTTGVDVFELP